MNSSREIVNMALNRKAAKNTTLNADEYIIRKSLSTSKWLLSKKAKSLGDGGEDKAFSSEQEARDFAQKNGLKVVNAEVVKNATAPEIERRLKAILSTEMPKVKKAYDDARAIDKSIKKELDRIYTESSEISDEDAKRLGKMIYDIRVMSPFGSM